MRIEGTRGTPICRTLILTLTLAVVSGIAQRPSPAPSQAKPVLIPRDLAEPSYQIYSALLPGGAIEWGDAPRSFWLLEDTTKAVPLDSSCATGGMMNPHESIQPPPSQQKNFAEVLADFDRRCHDRYQLDASQFHLQLPLHLVDEAGQQRYQAQVAGFLPPPNNIMQAPSTPKEFKGAAGMHSFTAVYFNKARTLAMTQFGMYCGGLCGNWSWVVLERKDGRWQSLPWVVMSAIS